MVRNARSKGSASVQKQPSATAFVTQQPLMFPPMAPAPQGGSSAWQSANATAVATAAAVAASWAREGGAAGPRGPSADKLRNNDLQATGYKGSSGRDSESHNSSDRSWRRSCEKQRAKLSAEKALVRRVAEWGPEVGHLVDLHTGKHKMVTYWLRADARALCLFDLGDTQVRMFSCAQMERCESLNDAPEVTARRFFLGFDAEGLRRGVLITMERSTHSVQVSSQGHIGIVRAQLLLLCKDEAMQQALLGALRALMAELLVHDAKPQSADAFNQLSEHGSGPGSLMLTAEWPDNGPSGTRISSSASPGPRRTPLQSPAPVEPPEPLAEMEPPRGPQHA